MSNRVFSTGDVAWREDLLVCDTMLCDLGRYMVYAQMKHAILVSVQSHLTMNC